MEAWALEAAPRRRQGVSARAEGRPILPVVWQVRGKARAVDGKAGRGIEAHGCRAICSNCSLQIVEFIGTHSANKDVVRNMLDRSGDFCLEKGFDMKRNLGSVTGRILFLQNVHVEGLMPSPTECAELGGEAFEKVITLG